MKTKICTKCHKEKYLSEFVKDKQKKDGYYSSCKVCVKLVCEEHKEERKLKAKIKWKIDKLQHQKERKARHLLYPWKLTFGNIKQRCNNPKNPRYKDWGGRGIKCLITEQELKQLWFRDRAYEMKQPSIDRKNNDGDYCLENCRFIEMVKNRPIRVRTRKILQFTKDGIFIKEWNSLKDAGKYYKIFPAGIGNCLRNVSKSAAGFIWKYKQFSWKK